MVPILRHPRRHQARRAGHPDPQHRADDLIDQGIRLHGLSAWRTDRQDFESRTTQIKALAFKGCRVPFFGPKWVAEKKTGEPTMRVIEIATPAGGIEGPAAVAGGHRFTDFRTGRGR